MSGEGGRYDPDSIQGLLFKFLNALYTDKKCIDVEPKGFEMKSGFRIRIKS